MTPNIPSGALGKYNTYLSLLLPRHNIFLLIILLWRRFLLLMKTGLGKMVIKSHKCAAESRLSSKAALPFYSPPVKKTSCLGLNNIDGEFELLDGWAWGTLSSDSLPPLEPNSTLEGCTEHSASSSSEKSSNVWGQYSCPLESYFARLNDLSFYTIFTCPNKATVFKYSWKNILYKVK